jgi:hypothetical protein
VWPSIRILGTGLLAGVVGAGFAGLAAAILGLSIAIAAGVAGVLLALIVGYFAHRYPNPPGAEH